MTPFYDSNSGRVYDSNRSPRVYVLYTPSVCTPLTCFAVPYPSRSLITTLLYSSSHLLISQTFLQYKIQNTGSYPRDTFTENWFLILLRCLSVRSPPLERSVHVSGTSSLLVLRSHRPSLTTPSSDLSIGPWSSVSRRSHDHS